ncbi:MAG: YjjG family noncanonical pyrimidine nucleotidase, partial [Bacteroidales bacterium]|nr:YjjG family noncanonical pyrimidine nucleotidase [Bacteroidales bacterium]
YKHLFFDIDRTLWDYETNAVDTLTDMYYHRKLENYGISLQKYLDEFYYWNDYYWEQFMAGEVGKETLRDDRFFKTLAAFGIDNPQLALTLSSDYIEISPTKTKLFPKVRETLEYLKKYYHLHVITNGFNEVQFQKLENSGIRHYFERIITSDSVGYRKPHTKIFEYALTSANAKKKESLMIGDNWDIDILGAKEFGIDQVYFNPHRIERSEKPTFEIFEFEELMKLL